MTSPIPPPCAGHGSSMQNRLGRYSPPFSSKTQSCRSSTSRSGALGVTICVPALSRTASRRCAFHPQPPSLPRIRSRFFEPLESTTTFAAGAASKFRRSTSDDPVTGIARRHRCNFTLCQVGDCRPGNRPSTQATHSRCHASCRFPAVALPASSRQ